ncbi:related to SAP190 - Sit4p-associated protein [Cephalotrichum gorgonifer]|uniref:Related to SAP190 - Sit4p-associated protein n=1 Tax=Cephalotrichum gorgonifer TaxID=2041049 RepID=A0AAE8N527_9PEZI|nr:related to SAP190 - Sit4p-associated protein [Cephalotrichum gorgonifer]
MFWRFGGYASVSAIDTLLDKDDFTLENLLDEADLLHEIKQHNAKLVEYLREDPVLEKLLNYVVAPRLEPVVATSENENDTPADEEKGKGLAYPLSRSRASSLATSETDEDESEKRRNRYAYVASEVLASDTWSIYEALMENGTLVREFWKFLKRPAPLDPLQASYFTKVNEALFEKKTEEMLEVLKSVPDVVSDLLRHVECPMIMDLLLKIIALDRTEGGQGIVEWLYTQDVVPILLSCLSPERNWVVQTAAGDFIKAIVTISANASQNEQQCIGPNELTRQLVSSACVEQLIQYMLTGGNPLTVGVGIVIEVIRKNNSDYDPDVGADEGSIPSCRDPIYLGTLLRLFAEHVPDFMNLIMHTPTPKKGIQSTFGRTIEPLGFDRFKTCELMAELLHCSNMGLMNEVGSEELIAARDLERHRLRGDGKLLPRRDDEASISAEDLTMRFSAHGGPHGDNRRLEVTNVAEDDGFEEVEHSREMNEDTSHEFVKAEDEMPLPVPIPSFFDKDDDDLMDEPLSSPRLHIKDDDDLDTHQFDEPDLVVAPLSPKKKDSAPAASDEPQSVPAASEEPKVKVEDAIPKVEDTTLRVEDATPKPETKETSVSEHTEEVPAAAKTSAEEARGGEDSDSSAVIHTPPSTGSQPEQDIADSKPSEAPKSEPKASETEKVKNDEEDSSVAQPPSSAVETPAATQTAEPTSQEPEATPEIPGPPPAAPAPPTSSESTEPPELPRRANVADDDSAEPGTESIIIGAVPDPPVNESRDGPVRAVVGDFLKMQFVEHKVVPSILSFFFKYQWNNFLHNVVYDIVQQVFNGPMDRGYNPTLAVSLFESADITNAIINGQRVSDESQARTRTRMGYMGHLTLIAEEVVKFTERHPPELLSETVLERVMSAEWVSYVEGSLAETRERDNAILGGVRPEVAMSNRAASVSGLAGVGLGGPPSSLSGLGAGQGSTSNALAEAGLNGSLDLNEGGSGMGPFAISAGTMMSGFGSSSDEEDDDAEETEEDINSEFRSYTDPLNNNGSSLDPPSIPPPPPPPPPLNIPPSRARLQLAARLAMHQKNAAAAAAASGDEEEEEEHRHSAIFAATSAVERDEQPRDPFGDDADEVDSDEDDHGGPAWSSGGGRGGWWRDVVMKRERLSDSEDEEEEGVDEEFGDFAMPEADAEAGAGGASPAGLRVVKPLAVHPGVGGGKSGFGSLWPFNTQNFGNSRAGKFGREGRDGGEDEEEETEGGIRRTTEAKKRTSLDDEDVDDEVVIARGGF